LIHPNTSDALNCFLGRSGYAITYLGGTAQQLPSTCSSVISFLSGAFWSLVIFVFFVVLGYLIGNRLFPQPRLVLDRFFGIVPAIISGSFILLYLNSFFRASGQPTHFQVNVQQANLNQFVPILFVIVIISIILALLGACLRK
jgi:surface polysaccharide O-acyltransferase-like enzyme